MQMDTPSRTFVKACEDALQLVSKWQAAAASRAYNNPPPQVSDIFTLAALQSRLKLRQPISHAAWNKAIGEMKVCMHGILQQQHCCSAHWARAALRQASVVLHTFQQPNSDLRSTVQLPVPTPSLAGCRHSQLAHVAMHHHCCDFSIRPASSTVHTARQPACPICKAVSTKHIAVTLT